MENPYHDGELKIQKLTGEEETAKRNGTIIQNEILGGAINFVSQQSFAVFATISDGGVHWASFVSGKKGFISAPDCRTVELDIATATENEKDPLWTNLQPGKQIGILLIELETRRRLKINGRIESISNKRATIRVDQSFPLCPKYIQRRKIAASQNTTTPNSNLNLFSCGNELTKEEIALTKRSDTVFLATSQKESGLDISHRGGKEGFIEVLSSRQLRFPDYSGNSMFNSFGNLVTNPQAGLVIVDFHNDQALQLTGKAFVELNQKDPTNKSGGTKRFWTFEIDRWQKIVLPVKELEFLDYSPFIPQ